MPQLVVTVRLRGVVIESRSLPVTGPLLVGEHPDAQVGFPGITLPVAPLPAEPHPWVPGGMREAAVVVGGIVLVPGQPHRIRNGHLEVEFAVERPDRGAPWRARPAAWSDVRLLVACGAVVLFALWFETVERWVNTDPQVAAELAALPSLTWRSAAPDAPPQDLPLPGVRVLPVEVQP